MTEVPTLSARLAEAIRAAACEGGCGTPEGECRAARIQPVVWHFDVLAEVEGTPEQFAAAVLPVVEAERAAAFREAADFLRDAHFRDGLTVQEIGTALRHTADQMEQS